MYNHLMPGRSDPYKYGTIQAFTWKDLLFFNEIVSQFTLKSFDKLVDKKTNIYYCIQFVKNVNKWWKLGHWTLIRRSIGAFRWNRSGTNHQLKV